MTIDPETVAARIAEIADAEIMARFCVLDEDEIDTKSGPQDFVTAADLAAERALEAALTDLRPGAIFIGEEKASQNPGMLEQMHDGAAYWIVDPLDGTRNFVEGRREFGTIVAYVEGGKTRAGWIYAIPDGQCAIGEAGSGATFDGARLTAPAYDPDRLIGFRAIGALAIDWRARFGDRLRDAKITAPARCSAYAYLHLLQGERDFGIYARAYPWDHAAGVLMLSEIGGRAVYLDDDAPYAPFVSIGRPLLVAPGDAAWRAARGFLMDAAAETGA